MSDISDRLLALIRRYRWAATTQLILAGLLVWLGVDATPRLSELADPIIEDAKQTFERQQDLPRPPPLHLANLAFRPKSRLRLYDFVVRPYEHESALSNECFSQVPRGELENLPSIEHSLDPNAHEMIESFLNSIFWACIEDVPLPMDWAPEGTLSAFGVVARDLSRAKFVADASLPRDWADFAYDGPRFDGGSFFSDEQMDIAFSDEFFEALETLPEAHARRVELYEVARVILYLFAEMNGAANLASSQRTLGKILWVMDLELSGREEMWRKMLSSVDGPEGIDHSASTVITDENIHEHYPALAARREFKRLIDDFGLNEDYSLQRADEILQQTIPVNILQMKIPRTPARVVIPLLILAVTLHMVGITLVLRRAMTAHPSRALWSDWHWLLPAWPAAPLFLAAGLFPLLAMGYFVYQQPPLSLALLCLAALFTVAHVSVLWNCCHTRRAYLAEAPPQTRESPNQRRMGSGPDSA